MKKYQAVAFKWRHFHGEVILQCVRWYCKYGISYRDLEEMMLERGLKIDHTTLYRWVQRYAPELKKKLDWYKKRYASRWHWNFAIRFRDFMRTNKEACFAYMQFKTRLTSTGVDIKSYCVIKDSVIDLLSQLFFK